MDARMVYREASTTGAAPTTLVLRLYEQMIEDLRQALQALERGDIERRTERINHVILILGHLESHLDFAQGGKVATDLQSYYRALRENLLYAQLHQSRTVLAQQITDLLALREAWIHVEQLQSPTRGTADRPNAANSPLPDETAGRIDWNG